MMENNSTNINIKIREENERLNRRLNALTQSNQGRERELED